MGVPGEGRSGLPGPFAEQVLDLVDAIPAGRVLAYGDVARLLRTGGPRQVGNVMAQFGGGVPWWRVVRADGRPAAPHEAEALARLTAEGTPVRRDAAGTVQGVDMAAARWPGPEGHGAEGHGAKGHRAP